MGILKRRDDAEREEMKKRGSSHAVGLLIVIVSVAFLVAAVAFFFWKPDILFDVNDEAVFERAPPHWLTVRIGTDDPRSRAMFFLDSDEELPRVLEDMQALVGGG